MTLTHDIGSNTSDGLTNDATLTFSALDLDASRVIKVDGNTVGSYNPLSLADGAHTVSVPDTDAAGNTSSSSVSFTLDKTVPASPVFDLAPASDSGTLHDHSTDASVVTLQGTTETNATVTLVGLGLTTTADAGGAFQFTNVALVLGPTPSPPGPLMRPAIKQCLH